MPITATGTKNLPLSSSDGLMLTGSPDRLVDMSETVPNHAEATPLTACYLGSLGSFGLVFSRFGTSRVVGART
jgi:hypothetical protein